MAIGGGFELFSMFGNVFLKGGTETKAGLDDIDKKAGTVNQSFEKAGGSGGGLAKFGQAALAVTAIVATAAVAIGTKAVTAAAEFEKGMANVATLLGGEFQTRIQELSGNVKGLMTETGQSAAVLQDGLYQVISAFGDSAESMEILETAAKGAAAGNATVTDSVNLLSAVTKGYGDTSAEAVEKASDLAFLTVKLGQTTFPELAASMGKVIPLAGSLKVSQEELFGAMATLTGVTGNTAEVSTQLRASLQGLMKPTGEMETALKKMGFESGAAALESLGLQGTLEGLKTSVGGNETEFANLFGSIEAGVAVLTLTGTQADNFTEKTKAMEDAIGATTEAYDRQQATFAAGMARMKQTLNVVMVEIGEALLPVVEDLMKELIKLVPPLMAFIKPLIEKLVPVFAKLAEALLPAVIKLLDAFLPILDPIIDLFMLLVDSVLIPLIDLLVPIIEDIMPVFVKLFEMMLPILRPLIELFFELMATILPPMVRIILELVQAFMPLIEMVLPLLTSALKWYSENIIPIFEKIFDKLQPIIDSVTGFIKDALAALEDFFAMDWSEKWETLKTKFAELWESMKEGVKNGLANIQEKLIEYIPQLIKWIVGLFETMNENLKKAWAAIRDRAKEGLALLAAKVREEVPRLITAIVNWFEELPKKIAVVFGYALGKLVAWIIDMKIKIDQELPRIIAAFKKYFDELPGNLFEALLDGLRKLALWAETFREKSRKTGEESVNGFLDFFKGLPGRLLAMLEAVARKLLDMRQTFRNYARDLAEELWKGFYAGLGIKPPVNTRAPTTNTSTVAPSGVAGITKGGAGRAFAEGIESVPESGMYTVGERGPEEVYLPRGAKVVPNHELGGPVVNIYNPHIFNQNDARELANLITDHWKLAGVRAR